MQTEDSEVEHNRRGWWDAIVTTGGEERAREGGEATTRHREGKEHEAVVKL